MERWIWIKRLFCWRLERPRLFLLNPPKGTNHIKPDQKRLNSGYLLIHILCFLVISLSFPTLSYPKIYKWIDEKGNIHFTDNPSELPPGIKIEEEEFFIPRTSPPTPKPDSKEEERGAEPERIQDKSQKEDWQTKLADIQKEIEKQKANEQALEKELKRPKYKQLVRQERLRRKELGDLKKEIARLEKERAEIEKKINAIH